MGVGSYAGQIDPTIERFRALARSSPWRWSTLRDVQERDPSGRDHHRGRQAWEAVLHPTSAYNPLCACCWLLLSELFEDAGHALRADDPGFVYPDGHRARIDVATGFCLYNEQLGGARNGQGHDISTEAVDEPMGEELFPQPPPPRWDRFLGRR